MTGGMAQTMASGLARGWHKIPLRPSEISDYQSVLADLALTSDPDVIDLRRFQSVAFEEAAQHSRPEIDEVNRR